MQPEIKKLNDTKLTGMKITMSFAQNRTTELWKIFMPKRKHINHQIGTDLFSVEIFKDADFLKNFNPNQTFEKWAAVQVHECDAIPESMETLVIPEGFYAVFQYKGKASDAPEMYQYIFGNWLPKSEYVLDNRPHFALMGDKYKNEDPNSEEELWIPIKRK
ncbi:MAG TPA: GyrI-like domain-containing protein [Prolixibacteraceae bacterium]|nr:GyrI-like domain-containing protein [Prolixibacteraceae bacterium]